MRKALKGKNSYFISLFLSLPLLMFYSISPPPPLLSISPHPPPFHYLLVQTYISLLLLVCSVIFFIFDALIHLFNSLIPYTLSDSHISPSLWMTTPTSHVDIPIPVYEVTFSSYYSLFLFIDSPPFSH